MGNVIHATLWLALNVWMEARGEPYEGKLAVAWVTMNRVKSKGWPNTVEGVVFQPYQFSWTNPDDPNRQRLDELDWNDPAFRDSHKAACAAFYELTPDPTDGADHYFNPHATKNRPPWYDPKKLRAVIGKHYFYKLR